MMWVESLEFIHFRNLHKDRLVFRPGLNIFLGHNGQGKSNILEAISLVTKGSSFRPFKNVHSINKDAHTQQCLVRATVMNRNVRQQLEFQVRDNLKQHYLDQKKISAQFLQRRFPLLIFSPESLSAIKSGSEARRNLVDDWITFYRPEKAIVLQEFDKALRTRNRLLNDQKKNKLYADEFDQLFTSLNHSFYRLSTELVLLRIQAIKDIHKFFHRAMCRISGEERKLQMKYLISDVDVTGDAVDKIGQFLFQRAEELRFAEVASGQSLFGPHKHDVLIEYNGGDSRYFCSQGQQRALILSFKIAQIVYYNARYGVYPLLLLDDVLSELDEKKRSFLIGFLKEYKAQIFLSATELENTLTRTNAETNIFAVQNGQIRKRTTDTAVEMESRDERASEFL